jgi:uncharacterized protein (DUF302 family)
MITATKLGTELQLDMSFDAALQRTREALKAEGFGILTEIDLQAAFKEKLGRDFRCYVILGACNPPLAYRAVSADPQAGLLLPCNVTVEAAREGETTIRLVDPESLLAASALGAASELRAVATDARDRLQRVARALQEAREGPSVSRNAHGAFRIPTPDRS